MAVFPQQLVTSLWPSGVKDMVQRSPCGRSEATVCQVSISRTVVTPFEGPIASHLPSGEKATWPPAPGK